MRLTSEIIDLLRSDFNALWSCQQRGQTFEISTPYVMPDSTFFMLFLTERDDRFIACDGGGIWEVIRERLDKPNEPDALALLRSLAQYHGIKEGSLNECPIFYKDCREEKLISSIAFDITNFATMAATVVLAH
jgi:hypothetical protein